MNKAVVIGAGFGGIASALRMREKGYDVTLVDRQNELGGRARVFRRNGFVSYSKSYSNFLGRKLKTT